MDTRFNQLTSVPPSTPSTKSAGTLERQTGRNFRRAHGHPYCRCIPEPCNNKSLGHAAFTKIANHCIHRGRRNNYIPCQEKSTACDIALAEMPTIQQLFRRREEGRNCVKYYNFTHLSIHAGRHGRQSTRSQAGATQPKPDSIASVLVKNGNGKLKQSPTLICKKERQSLNKESSPMHLCHQRTDGCHPLP